MSRTKHQDARLMWRIWKELKVHDQERRYLQPQGHDTYYSACNVNACTAAQLHSSTLNPFVSDVGEGKNSQAVGSRFYSNIILEPEVLESEGFQTCKCGLVGHA